MPSSALITPVKVKLAVTHHVLSSDKVSQEKPLVFLMDPPKDPKEDREEGGRPKRKKQKKEKGAGTMTNKNFGSVVDIAKLKKANRLLIGWRIRLLDSKILFGGIPGLC